MKNNTILILALHTDDGELGCGGTISRFVENRNPVYYAAFSTTMELVTFPLPPDIFNTI